VNGSGSRLYPVAIICTGGIEFSLSATGVLVNVL
jgi:hypothetical protein